MERLPRRGSMGFEVSQVVAAGVQIIVRRQRKVRAPQSRMLGNAQPL